MQKNVKTSIVALTLLFAGNCLSVEAGLFNNRGNSSRSSARHHSGHSSASIESSPYNKTGRPLTNFGHNWIVRKHEQDARVAARTGKPVEQVTQQRVRRLELFGAAVGGMADGLSSAASGMNYSAPATVPFGHSPSLPSNFSQQMNWNSYNRNYSTNPWHAPAH